MHDRAGEVNVAQNHLRTGAYAKASWARTLLPPPACTVPFQLCACRGPVWGSPQRRRLQRTISSRGSLRELISITFPSQQAAACPDLHATARGECCLEATQEGAPWQQHRPAPRPWKACSAAATSWLCTQLLPLVSFCHGSAFHAVVRRPCAASGVGGCSFTFGLKTRRVTAQDKHSRGLQGAVQRCKAGTL